MINTQRLNKIKQATITKPYVYLFFFVFFAYIGINTIINQIYVTIPTLFQNNLWIVIPFVAFSLITALLVALNVSLVVIKYKELKQITSIQKQGGIAGIGVFGGLLAGACPSCFVGLFPAFLGFFGVTASLSSLPLYGIEIQILSGVLLTVSAFLLTRPNVCKIKLEKITKNG
ncbi:hypothetical protein CL622_03160 [archaeon]|nr:hypothetical protein [archaeon]|tara:strand:- start:3167 stop:3685 length:519 start_codon:yes stop_codon:yes gene_type:complete